MILQELGLSGPSELDRLRNQALLRAIQSTSRENRQDALRVSNQLTESRMNWTCYLCHKQCSLDNIDELSQCMHKYCSQCAQAYLKYKINAKEEVYCPEISCGEPVAKTSQHFINLTADFRRRFEENELASKQLRSNPSLMLCKRYQCNAIVEISPEGPLVCKKCETIHCRKCRQASHVNGCKYLQPLFLDAGHNPEEASPPPQLLKLKQAAALQAAAKAAQPHPGSPIDSVVALIPIAASKASQPGKTQPNTQQATAVSSQANQPNTLVVSQVVRVPDGPLGVSPIIPLPNNNSMMAPVTETRILAPGVSHVMDAGANPAPPVLGGAPMADAATNRQSPARDSAPVPTKCTAMNIVLWILLPISIIITVVALIFVLLLEVFFAVGKSVFTFIKGNFAKSKSSWWTALLVVTIPFQILAGIFGAYFILKKEESYKFGLYLKKTFLFLEKLYPLQVRHCLNKTPATST